jgi:hypothetical protein
LGHFDPKFVQKTCPSKYFFSYAPIISRLFILLFVR